MMFVSCQSELTALDGGGDELDVGRKNAIAREWRNETAHGGMATRHAATRLERRPAIDALGGAQ
jgi:hypothetical protein